MLSSGVQYRLSEHDDSIQTTLQYFFKGNGSSALSLGDFIKGKAIYKRL